MSDDLASRFWAKVICGEADACWLWAGAKSAQGYGKIGTGEGAGKTMLATHAALQIAGLPRPSPKHIALHGCDNPSCVNVRHLRWGTYADNYADMVERERAPRVAAHFAKRRRVNREMDEAASRLQISRKRGKGLVTATVV